VTRSSSRALATSVFSVAPSRGSARSPTGSTVEHVLVAVRVDAHCTNHVITTELQAVDVHHQHVRLVVVTRSLSQPWLGDAPLPLLQSDTPALRAVIHDFAVGLLALLLWPGELLCVHGQHGLDRGPAHHVGQIIDRTLRLLDPLAVTRSNSGRIN